MIEVGSSGIDSVVDAVRVKAKGEVIVTCFDTVPKRETVFKHSESCERQRSQNLCLGHFVPRKLSVKYF
jgi:hypothetical protein